VLTVRHAIPASQERRTFPDAGGLMSYGASRMDGMRFAGWISRARAIHFRRACYGRGRSCRRDNRAHNGLVGGSSPSSPTTHSREPGDFLTASEWPAIGGHCRGRFGLCWRPIRSKRGFRASCLWPSESRFPETETVVSRDAFECLYYAIKPSI
jgi:hypothetical protein